MIFGPDISIVNSQPYCCLHAVLGSVDCIWVTFGCLFYSVKGIGVTLAWVKIHNKVSRFVPPIQKVSINLPWLAGL